MSNNPVSFVDPDGGWDEWWNKNGIAFYIDGMRVDPYEFNAFIKSPSHGDQVNFSGSFFSGSTDYLSTFGKDLSYNIHQGSWGIWRDFKGSANGNLPSRANEIEEEGEIVWDEGDYALTHTLIGLKWLRSNADETVSNLFKGTGVKLLGSIPANRDALYVPVRNSWGKIADSGWIGKNIIYGTSNGVNIFLKSWTHIPYPQNLDGSFNERGSADFQEAWVGGVLTLAPMVGQSAGLSTKAVAASGSAKTSTSLVQANRTAGNLFRDELAAALRAEGRVVETEVFKRTPFGPRYMDIDVWYKGVNLGGIETKVGSSRYLSLQQIKDAWLGANGYPVQLVRKPSNW